MGWHLPIPVDAAACGILAIVLSFLAYRFRTRIVASAPACAVFLVLLTVPLLVGIARLQRLPAQSGFMQAVAVEAYAMLLGMMLPMAIVLVVMERGRRAAEIARCCDDIEDLRGWKNPAAARRIGGLARRLSRMGVSGLDLSRCDLRRINLNGLSLRAVKLVGADMGGANLARSDLTGADLQGAVLRRGVLRRARLAEAVFWGADLREAELAGADLTGTLLKEADLSGADLSDASLANVRGLTVDQLGRVRSLNGADLPQALLAKVKERHPALLRAG